MITPLFFERTITSRFNFIFLKNEVLHVIDRHREFTPLVKKTNLEIDKLKQYFNPKERNYILKVIKNNNIV